MFFVGFYPTGEPITADVDYINEKGTNIFFVTGTPIAMI